MNIVFISLTYPTPIAPHQGAFNASLVDSLRQRHNVHVVAPVPWTQWVASGFDANSDADQAADHPLYWYPPRCLHRHADRFLWRSIRQHISKLKAFNADVVVGYWLHPDGTVAVRAADELQVPCVLMSGGSDLKLLSRSPSRRRKIQATLASCDRLVVVSEDLKWTAAELKVPAEKVSVCYRGIDQDVFQPTGQNQARATLGLASDEIVLLWVGRLEPVKNPQMLLHAARHWQQHWAGKVSVLMAGSGSMRTKLQRQIAAWGLENVVQLTGPLDRQELALRFNAADCTVLTSDSEGVPNVLLESIACGTRVVATDVGGISEVITPGLDSLVPAGDAAALADAVVQRIAEPAITMRRYRPPSNVQAAAQFETLLTDVVNSRTADVEKNTAGAKRSVDAKQEAVA